MHTSRALSIHLYIIHSLALALTAFFVLPLIVPLFEFVFRCVHSRLRGHTEAAGRGRTSHVQYAVYGICLLAIAQLLVLVHLENSENGLHGQSGSQLHKKAQDAGLLLSL